MALAGGTGGVDGRGPAGGRRETPQAAPAQAKRLGPGQQRPTRCQFPGVTVTVRPCSFTSMSPSRAVDPAFARDPGGVASPHLLTRLHIIKQHLKYFITIQNLIENYALSNVGAIAIIHIGLDIQGRC